MLSQVEFLSPVSLFSHKHAVDKFIFVPRGWSSSLSLFHHHNRHLRLLPLQSSFFIKAILSSQRFLYQSGFFTRAVSQKYKMASSTQNNYIIPTSWINELPYMDNSPNHPFELQTRLFGSIMTAIEAQNPRSRSAAEYLIVWGSALYGDGWKGIFGQISVVDTTVDQMFGLAQLDWEEASVAVRKICPQGEVKHLRKFWLHFKVVDIFNKHKYWSAVFDAAVVEPAVADAEPEPEDEVTDADMEVRICQALTELTRYRCDEC